MPAGRPSKYRPEFAEQAEKLCKLGATDADLADFFGVNTTTIWRWQSQFPEFCNALKVAKEEADARVERSLYQRATGYTFSSEKVFQFQGKVVRTPVVEHCPPDTTAMIFWLKNRKPDEWRDARDVNVRRFDQMSEEELDRAIAERLAALDESGEGRASKPH